jgi:hypothetical protein
LDFAPQKQQPSPCQPTVTSHAKKDSSVISSKTSTIKLVKSTVLKPANIESLVGSNKSWDIASWKTQMGLPEISSEQMKEMNAHRKFTTKEKGKRKIDNINLRRSTSERKKLSPTLEWYNYRVKSKGKIKKVPKAIKKALAKANLIKKLDE